MKNAATCATLMLGVWLASNSVADQPAVTVYNQKFGVVREKVTLDLKPGVNPLRCTEITAHLEPDSVILRDPTGRHRLQVLEQNYRADPLSQELLLSESEGKTLEFLVFNKDAPDNPKTITAKIIRTGYVPHRQAWNEYGQQYRLTQMQMVGGGSDQPIIEIDGKLRFGLPGTPIFPSLGDDTILKPTLSWLLETDAAGKLDAELSYVTGGMSWKADYNLVSPAEGNVLELVGWVTIDNQSGRTFEDAHIKLMAGEVSKIQPAEGNRMIRDPATGRMIPSERMPQVAENTFDEYHVYTLQRPTTLRDREIKQVEFVRAVGIQSQRFYVYDGTDRCPETRDARAQPDYGTRSNPRIWAMREFKNNGDNHLGLPLPAGRLRFYRGDDDGRLEFVGENEIDHTPKDELVRVYTGNAFDLVGERRQTDFKANHDQKWLDESFEVKVRNHKLEPVEVRIVEHLYRFSSWEVREPSQDYEKKDAQTIEFRVTIPPDGEQTVTYTVHYTW